MALARTQHGTDELVSLAIEDQQGVIDVLAVEAVIRAAFLVAMHRVIGPVQVQHDVGWPTTSLALTDVEHHQHLGQGFADLAVDLVLQAREGRL